MARTKQSKKRKNVTVQEDTSSEERRSEDSPKDPKAASHIRTAENMLNAVSLLVLIYVICGSTGR